VGKIITSTTDDVWNWSHVTVGGNSCLCFGTKAVCLHTVVVYTHCSWLTSNFTTNSFCTWSINICYKPQYDHHAHKILKLDSITVQQCTKRTIIVFWDTTNCRLLDMYQGFNGTNFHFGIVKGGSTTIQNVGTCIQNYRESQPRELQITIYCSNNLESQTVPFNSLTG
jgi:hypothetical protein